MAVRLPPPSECAQCGADIRPNAHACPECGADERTGWREASIYDGIDFPDTAAERTSSSNDPSNRTVNGIPWYWWTVGVILLLLLGRYMIGLR